MTPDGLNEDLKEVPPDCEKRRPAQTEGYPTPSQKRMCLFCP